MRMVVAAVSMMVVVDRGRRWRWRRRGETVIVAGIMPGAGEHGSERAQSDESAAHGCSKIFAGFLAMHGASLVGRPPRSRCRAHHPGSAPSSISNGNSIPNWKNGPLRNQPGRGSWSFGGRTWKPRASDHFAARPWGIEMMDGGGGGGGDEEAAAGRGREGGEEGEAAAAGGGGGGGQGAAGGGEAGDERREERGARGDAVGRGARDAETQG